MFFSVTKLYIIYFIIIFDFIKKITKIYNVEIIDKFTGYKMRLIERLKDFEQQYVFLRWVSGGEYGKVEFVGDDFVEFTIVDVDSMECRETMLINAQLILEIAYGGADVSRIIAEVSSQLSFGE